MTWLKRILILIVIAAIGFFAWNWAFGPIKAKRQIVQFAAAMETCEPLEQTVTFMSRGNPKTHSVKGQDGDMCVFEVQTAAPFPEFIVCTLPMAEMPVIAESYGKQGDNIGIFGGVRFTMSTESQDPYFLALNSPACVAERR